MATAHLLRTARFTYTPPGGSPVVHLLALPLRELEVIDSRSRYDWWSEDGTSREIVTVGPSVREMVATIRMEDQPNELRAMLRAAIENDVTLNYEPTTGGTSYPVKVVRVLGGDGGVQITLDRSRRGWEARIHIRRVDGGTLDGIIS